MDLTTSSADWISQLETEEDYGHGWAQLEMAPFHSVFQGDCDERAAKQLKRSSSSSWCSPAPDLRHFSGATVISFGSSSIHNQYDVKPKLEALETGQVGSVAGGSGGVRPRAGGFCGGAPADNLAREHVLAERKRREKLTQRFITLSALLPGLKKLDKASVLGEAARYVKQLEEQVKALREQTSQSAVESGVTNPRKTGISSIEQDPNPTSSSSSNDNFDSSSSGEPLPTIEARFSEKDVLINVQCQKKQGTVPRVLAAVQKLHLSIVNCNAMPFGEYTMVVTIVAKMNDEFSATTMELVNMVRQNLQTLM